MQTVALEPEHRRWVEGYAAKAHRRLKAAGCSTLQIDDVRQECWIAWCKARDTFEPGRGAAFGTYLYKGMELHLRHFSRKLREAAALTALGDEAILVAEGSLAFAPVEEVACRDHDRRRVLARMSAETRRVMELVLAPPAWLLEEFRAARAKVEWCRRRGFALREITDVRLVAEALGFRGAVRGRIEAELARFARSGSC